MTYVFPADVITPKDLPMVGGKAYALAELSQAGFEDPGFLCISTDAYREYIDRTGLQEKILLELHRKVWALPGDTLHFNPINTVENRSKSPGE